MTDEEKIGRWFSEVTKPQLAVYNQRMADVAPYRCSPRWERARTAAQNEFHDGVGEARRIYEAAIADLLANGEVTEEVDAAMTNYRHVEIVQQQAAE